MLGIDDLLIIVGVKVADCIMHDIDPIFTLDPEAHGVPNAQVKNWFGQYSSVPLFKHTNHDKQVSYHVGLYLNDSDGSIDVIATPITYKETL